VASADYDRSVAYLERSRRVLADMERIVSKKS